MMLLSTCKLSDMLTCEGEIINNIICPEQFENHAKVSSVVVDLLKKYVKDNDLKVNDKLPSESELCNLLHVSRASIREAMKSLESEGLLYSVQGKGRFIRSFNYDQMVEKMTYNLDIHFKDFDEIVQVRKALESYFLPKVMKMISPNDLEQLESILDEMEDQVQKGASYRELAALHTFFHKSLYKKLNNRLLDSLISMFSSYQRMLSKPDQDNESFIRQHRDLLTSIEEKNEQRVRQNLEEHFRDFE